MIRFSRRGEVAEWSNAHDSKSCIPERVSRVRIPPSPPICKFPSMLLSFIIVVVSLFALVKSANLLVDGASSFAKRLGVSSLVIGLTIVAFGTSAPELSVNITSAIKGVTDIAVGNVVGSNIANILLILGIVAWMKGVKLEHSTVWKEVPFMFLSALIVLIMASDVLL